MKMIIITIMNYCPGCDNVFNYEEDLKKKILIFRCDKCNINKKLNDPCISIKTFKTKTKKYINYHDSIYDNTLKTHPFIKCNKCSGDVVQISNEDLTVTYVCKKEDCRNIM